MLKPIVNSPHALYVNGELIGIITNADPVTGGLASLIDGIPDGGGGTGVLPIDGPELTTLKLALEAMRLNGVMGQRPGCAYVITTMFIDYDDGDSKECGCVKHVIYDTPQDIQRRLMDDNWDDRLDGMAVPRFVRQMFNVNGDEID
jgi:hypothetical protein